MQWTFIAEVSLPSPDRLWVFWGDYKFLGSFFSAIPDWIYCQACRPQRRVSHWQWCNYHHRGRATSHTKPYFLYRESNSGTVRECSREIARSDETYPRNTETRRVESKYLISLFNTFVIFPNVGLGGTGVTCSPQEPRFADSNPAEVDGFFQDVKFLSISPPGGPLSRKSRVWDFKLVKEPRSWKNRPLSKT